MCEIGRDHLNETPKNSVILVSSRILTQSMRSFPLSPELTRVLAAASRRGTTDYFRVVISSFYLPSSFPRDREARQTANHNSYARNASGQDDAVRKKGTKEEPEGDERPTSI